MEYCPLCQFEMSRNLCMQCIENFEDTGMDRDEAEEAYLAAVPDEDEDEENDEPEIKRYSFPVTVTVMRFSPTSGADHYGAAWQFCAPLRDIAPAA